MERTITIRGIGRARTRPDTIVIPMTVESTNTAYAQAIESNVKQITLLREAVKKSGFRKEDLKTVNYIVQTVYHSEKDMYDNYRSVFDGYRCRHDLKLEFDFDTDRLGMVLKAVSESKVSPELNIRFTVKDVDGVTNEMLQTAAIDANVKALTLCRASGVEMGELVSIDYSWGEINLYSDTRLDMDCCNRAMDAGRTYDMEPEEIETRDTVTFIWTIKRGAINEYSGNSESGCERNRECPSRQQGVNQRTCREGRSRRVHWRG